MKAKKILKSLVEAGMVRAEINTGESIKKVVRILISGELKNKCEYIFTFRELSHVNESAVIITSADEKAFLYQI